MLIMIPILIAVFLVYLAQMLLYTRHTFDRLDYRISLSAEEIFEEEDLYMVEEISNGKSLPLPYLKADTELPEGMKFVLTDPNRSGRASAAQDSPSSRERTVQSIFVLRGHQTIRRRWRVSCLRRGVYSLGKAVVVSNDLFGFHTFSRTFSLPLTRHNQVTVLPRSINLARHFISAHDPDGDLIVPRGPLPDPTVRAGTREYLPSDPMSRINWKSSASHGHLMVNIEEYTEKNRFNLIMNMQSRPVELHPEVPSAPEFVEMCITVCASILEMAAEEEIPVRVFANTSPEPSKEERQPDAEDSIDAPILCTRPYTGRKDIREALRMLAALPLTISLPVEKMLDHILLSPEPYTSGDNIIVISSYLCERMIVFHELMAQKGVRVVFYITSGNQNAMIIPDHIPVYYRLYKKERGEA